MIICSHDNHDNDDREEDKTECVERGAIKMRRNNDMDAIGCVVFTIIAIIAMPLLGVYLIAKGEKGLGIALIVVGIIIYCFIGAYRG